MNQVVCNKKDECSFKGCTSATEHGHSDICDTPCKGAQGVKGAVCLPVPTDLFGPLTPPRGVEEPALVRCNKADICRARCTTHVDPHEWTSYCDVPCTRKAPGNGGYCEPVPQPAPAKSYVCNEAGECGIEDCIAAEEHTHNEPPLHGPRECGFTHQVVNCQEVPELVKCDTRKEYRVFWESAPSTEPLRGVWVSGKALEVLTQYQDWSNDKWDAFWATVTGKAARHTDAKRVMRDANGAGVTEDEYREAVRRLVLGACVDYSRGGRDRFSFAPWAATKIAELPRPETP